MFLIEVFPGQGSKKYDSKNPECDLLLETLENYHKLKTINSSIKPQFLFGNSYGIYAALVVAGIVGVAVALELAKKRADLVRESEQKREESGEGRTGMLSILGPTRETLEVVAKELEVYLTNYNGPIAHVASGLLKSLKRFEEEAPMRFGRCKTSLLPIEGAYHCLLRKKEGYDYGKYLKQFKFNEPRIPLISSTRPRVLDTVQDVVQELEEQMVYPVDLPEAVNLFLRYRIEYLLETGPGSSIKKFTQRIAGNKLKIFSLEEDEEEIKKLTSKNW